VYELAIISGYNMEMEVTIVEAKNTLSDLIRKVEQGEEVVIRRHGRSVARLVKAEPKRRVLGGAKDRVDEVDPDWWKPMSDQEADDFYAGR
jgi:prevent-host-death family protein